jgi:hypothetical protein
VSSLVADPSNPNRFYAGVPTTPFGPTGLEGVYRSDDGGVTWTAVNTGLTGLSTSFRILLSVHSNQSNAVYAAIADRDSLLGMFRSTNFGKSWTAMGVPDPPIFPGSQLLFHGAIAADPSDPNVVFVSGDRQDIPNPNGCFGFTGNTFRGDASLLPGSPWTSVDCDGAGGTSPHADARRIAFDANGDLLLANDGGLYRLFDPNDRVGQRHWISVNGGIRPTELHSVAFDPVSNIVLPAAKTWERRSSQHQVTPLG